jgi:hypothetical protein
MDKVQKHNLFNTNTPSLESYRNYFNAFVFQLLSSGAHPASNPMVPAALSLGVKRPGREADHSPPSIAEVNE